MPKKSKKNFVLFRQKNYRLRFGGFFGKISGVQKRLKTLSLLVSYAALALVVAGGCATQTTTTRPSKDPSRSGRQAIKVEVFEKEIRYLGNPITKERLVKRLLDDEVKNNAPSRLSKKSQKLQMALWRPVELHAKEQMPDARLDDLAEYLEANSILNVIVMKPKVGVSYKDDEFE